MVQSQSSGVLDYANCGDYRIMDKIMREFSLQECLKEIDSDCGVNGDTLGGEMNSFAASAKSDHHHVRLTARNGTNIKPLENFTECILGENNTDSKTSRMMGDKGSSGSSDEKLPVQCGISEKESKCLYIDIHY